MTEFPVTVKQLEPVLVASVRNESLVKRYDEGGLDISKLYETLYGFVGDHAADPQINLWHGNEERLEPEVTTSLKERMASSKLVKVYELPIIATAATVEYHGHYADAGMMQAFKALHSWVESNQYREVGPVRQVFHPRPDETAAMNIELQVMIKKI